MLGGQMNKARQNVQLTAAFLKATLGLVLTSEEIKLEENYESGEPNRKSLSKTTRSKHKK